MSKQNWFNTLNDALCAEGFMSVWPLGLNINYGETKSIIANGMFISIYRETDGRYERPIYYATRAGDTV